MMIVLLLVASMYSSLGTRQVGAEEVPSRWQTDLARGLVDARARGADVLLLLRHANEDVAIAESLATACGTLDGDRKSATVIPVLIDLTFDRSGLQSPQNAAFTAAANRLDVRCLPAALLLGADGRPVGRIEGLHDPGLTLHLQIHELQVRRLERDRLRTEAEASAGPAKAALLDRMLKRVGDFALTEYLDVAEEIVKLDTDGSLHLRETYGPAVAQRAIDEVIQNEVYSLIDRGDYAQARARLIGLTQIAGPSVAQRQMILAFAAQLLFTQGQHEDAISELKSAQALAPDSSSADRIAMALKQMTSETTQ